MSEDRKRRPSGGDDLYEFDDDPPRRIGGWMRAVVWLVVAAFVLPLVIGAVQQIVD